MGQYNISLIEWYLWLPAAMETASSFRSVDYTLYSHPIITKPPSITTMQRRLRIQNYNNMSMKCGSAYRINVPSFILKRRYRVATEGWLLTIGSGWSKEQSITWVFGSRQMLHFFDALSSCQNKNETVFSHGFEANEVVVKLSTGFPSHCVEFETRSRLKLN